MRFAIKYYKSTIAIFTLLFLFFLFQIPKLIIDNSIDKMLPPNNRIRLLNSKYERIFGVGDSIVIVIETNNIFDRDFLIKCKELTDSIRHINRKIAIDEIKKSFSIGESEATTLLDFIFMYGSVSIDSLDKILTNTSGMQDIMEMDSKLLERIAGIYAKMSIDEKRRLYKALLPHIDDVISIIDVDYVEGVGDKVVVENIINKNKIDKEEIGKLKERLAKWDIYDGFLIARDKSSTAIVVKLKSMDKEDFKVLYSYILKAINSSKLKDYKMYIAGEAVVKNLLGEYMIKDIKLLFPFVVMVIVTVLYLSFRSFVAMIIPIIAVLFATVYILGLMAMVGVPINLISFVIPLLLIAVGSAYGIHLVNHYMLMSGDKKKAILEALSHVSTPVMMTTFTTISVFGALISSKIIPVRNFGLYTAIGIFVSLVITLAFVPAMIMAFNLKSGKTKRENRFLLALYSISTKNRVLVVVIVLLLFAASIIGTTKINVDTDAIRMFKKDSYLRRSNDYIVKHYLGTTAFVLVIRSDKINGGLTPHILNIIDKLEAYLKANKDISRYIGGVLSICDYIKKANKSMHGEDSSYYIIPKTKQEILDYMLTLKSKVDEFVNRDGNLLRVIVQLKTGSNLITKEIKEVIDNYLKANAIIDYDIVGDPILYLEADRLIIKGIIISIILSMFVVFVLNIIVFHSIMESAISIIPILLAILINFGIMGFAGIMLDIGTSMITFIAIGIGINYTIHYLAGFKRHFISLKDSNMAIRQTTLITGRAILYNMVAVVFGFAVLLFSSFIPLIKFGSLIPISVLTIGILSLTIIPAMLKLFEGLKYNEK